MIISNKNGNVIYKSWRENGVKKSEEVEFRPYFYVSVEEPEITHYPVSKYARGEFKYEEGDWVSLEGYKLKRVYVQKSFDIYKARQHFSKTYEADVPYTFRYAVDEIDEMPEYNMRKWYWDMEWQQGGEHDNCITTIVMYDNYDKEYYQWAWFPNDINTGGVYFHDKERVFGNEKDMIENFMGTMIAKDPDMLIAWFGLKFDLPKLLDRACALGLNPLVMSPYHKIDGVKQLKDSCSFKRQDGYSPIEQPIGGRLTLNLDLAFERQWNDAQRGTLPSLSLDYVSNTLFGEGKKMDTKFEDPNEFYRRGWLEDTEAYLAYAIQDVELLRRIDEENYTSEAILSLQKLLVAPFDYCFFASYMGGVYFMRNASWKAPTGSRPKHKVCDSCNHKNDNDKTLKECVRCGESLSYSGAMIYNPLDEGTNGLHHNVAAFDFAGLYPSMIIARNISFETKSNEVTVFGADLNTPQNLQPKPDDYKPDMLYYNTDELGLLPKSLISLKELRNEYKANLKEARKADDKLEVAKWNNNQMAVKRLMASFYGILAFRGFGWSNKDLAASITASAREAIRLAAFKAREMEV